MQGFSFVSRISFSFHAVLCSLYKVNDGMFVSVDKPALYVYVFVGLKNIYAPASLCVL